MGLYTQYPDAWTVVIGGGYIHPAFWLLYHHGDALPQSTDDEVLSNPDDATCDADNVTTSATQSSWFDVVAR